MTKKFDIVDGQYHHVKANGIRRIKTRTGFAAGIADRLTDSFQGSYNSINEELKNGLRRMRARSRELAMNVDHAVSFFNLVKNNIVGAHGIKLQADTLDAQGNPDLADNDRVEQAWQDFGKVGNCSADRKLSFNDIEKLAILGAARDGESICRFIDTPGEDYGLRLRLYPAEALDENHNRDLPNGNRIIMGVEYTAEGMITAYHLRKDNEARLAAFNLYPQSDYDVIPARDIIHLHLQDYPDQVRGFPWAHSAIRRLNMIGKYEEAELVAAVVGSSKMGFFRSEDNGVGSVDEVGPDSEEYDVTDATISAAEPGTFHRLNAGEEFITFDADHPSTAFDAFTRAVLRGAAAGLPAVSYHGLSGDLENVNFSSIRAGVLEERDQWTALQKWFSDHFHQRIYDRWIWSAVLNGRLDIPARKIDAKFKRVNWQGRGWDWVDPLRDAKANAENLAHGLDTRTDILAKRGLNYEDVVKRLAREAAIAEQYGVNINDVLPSSNQTGEFGDD